MQKQRFSINATTTKEEKERVNNAFSRACINVGAWVMDQLSKKADEIEKDGKR